MHFIEEYLALPGLFAGFQSRFGRGSDLILFRSPKTGSTLAVDCSVMLETCDLARQTVQAKIEENFKSFQGAA